MPRFLLFAAACLLATAAAADVTCPPIFGDRMVLQRDRPVPVWGSADPAERITVKFGGQTHQAVAGPDGRWRVTLDPLAASGQPRLLSIRGKNTLLFADVLVGEVWLCSGQSNMEKPLGPRVRQMPTDNYEAELTQAECPPLRLFRMPKLGVAQPGDHTRTWLACSAESLMAADFSAAAYYFGRELVRELGVPVGLVQSTVGGTRIEAWMPLAAFEADPALRGLEKVRYPQSVEGLQATELYTAMIAPLAPYALRGFLWYQGEANCLNAENESYTAKMRGLIQSWRNAWNDGAAPFYFAQLAPYTYSALTNRPKQVTAEALPALWEAQQRALALGRTGIIATSDITSDVRDIHPTNKRDVGLRFARLALADTYGRADIAAQAPRLASSKRPWRGRALEISLAHADGLRSRDGQPLAGFTIAGEDRVFHPAEAVIRDGRLVVSSPRVARPAAVRFAWHETAMPNLVNAAGLPALPFRTDAWPLVLEVPKAPAADAQAP